MPRATDQVQNSFEIVGFPHQCYFCADPHDLIWVYTPRITALSTWPGDKPKYRVKSCKSCASGLSFKQKRLPYELSLEDKSTLMLGVAGRKAHIFQFPAYRAEMNGDVTICYVNDRTDHVIEANVMARIRSAAPQFDNLRNHTEQFRKLLDHLTGDKVIHGMLSVMFPPKT